MDPVEKAAMPTHGGQSDAFRPIICVCHPCGLPV